VRRVNCAWRPIMWAFFIGSLVFLNGCIDLTLHGTIEKEGRVTLNLKIKAVDQVLKNAVKEAASGQDSFPILQKKKLVRRVDKLKGFLPTYRNELVAGIRDIEVEVQLNHPGDVNTLNLLDVMRLDYQDDGSWLWSFGDVPLGGALGNMDQTSLLQQIELLAPILKGMKLDLQLTVPEVIETNLNPKADQTLSYSIDFDRDISSADSKKRLIAYEELLKPKFIKIGGLQPPIEDPKETP